MLNHIIILIKSQTNEQIDKFLFVGVMVCTAPMPPLPKGRWPGEAGSEGYCGKMLQNNGISAKTYCGKNPPVSFADSPL